MAFSPADAQIICGIQLNPGTEDTSIEEQVGLILNHPAAKLLAEMLTLLINDFEDSTGQKIQLDPQKLDPLRKIISEKKKQREKAKRKPTKTRPK